MKNFNIIFYFNNYIYLFIITVISLTLIYRFIRQRKRSEGKILKMIKELEDKLINI